MTGNQWAELCFVGPACAACLTALGMCCRLVWMLVQVWMGVLQMQAFLELMLVFGAGTLQARLSLRGVQSDGFI